MGNKQGKGAPAGGQASEEEVPAEKVPQKDVDSTMSSTEDSPNVPAFIPDSKAQVQGDETEVVATVADSTEEAATKVAITEHPLPKADPTPETQTTDGVTNDVTAKADEEKNKNVTATAAPGDDTEPGSRNNVPPLDIENMNKTPPVPVVQEKDPNLMEPPRVITDEFATLTEKEHYKNTSDKKPDEKLTLSMPVSSNDDITLEEPVLVTTPEAEQSDAQKDAGKDQLECSDPIESEELGVSSFSDPRAISIPEDALSFTSSVARQDEVLKNVMVSKKDYSYLTSNESVIGSVAVSEMTLDESHWDLASRQGTSKSKGYQEDEERIIEMVLEVLPSGSVVVKFSYLDSPNDEFLDVEGEKEVHELVEDVFDKAAVPTREIEGKTVTPVEIVGGFSFGVDKDASADGGKGVTVGLYEQDGVVKLTMDSNEKESVN